MIQFSGEDSNKNLQAFKKKLIKNEIIITEGGRFIHFNVGYDKGKAVAKFLEIYKKQKFQSVLSISLGDSENDVSMLELTDYSCCIKSPKKKLYLKKVLTIIIVRKRPLLDGKSL